MQISNFVWTYWVKNHQADFEGAFVQKIQGLTDGSIRLKTRSPHSGKHEYIITPETIFESQLQLSAAAQQNGFAAFLNKRLLGQQITGITQHEWDKVIIISFHEFQLVVELFAKGNMVLMDQNGIILQPYHREEWKDRKLYKDEKYRYPNSMMKNWSHQTITQFQTVLNKDPNRAKALIIHAGISPAIANEMAKMNANDQALFRSVQALCHQKLQPTFVIVGNEKWLLPFMLADGATKHFQVANQTLDEIMQQEYASSVETKSVEPVVSTKRVPSLEKAIARQLEAKKKFEDEMATNQQKGQLILAHQAEVDELLTAIKTARQKNVPEKEIESKLLEAKKKGQQGAKLISKLNLKGKKIELNVE